MKRQPRSPEVLKAWLLKRRHDFLDSSTCNCGNTDSLELYLTIPFKRAGNNLFKLGPERLKLALSDYAVLCKDCALAKTLIRCCARCQIEKTLENFSNKSAGRKNSYCKDCQSLYGKKHYAANSKKYMARAKNWNREYQRKKKMVLWILKSGACVDCNRKFSPWCMDYDHLGNEEKTMNVGTLVALRIGIKRMFDEIEKCELTCARCHRKRTYKRMMESGIMTRESFGEIRPLKVPKKYVYKYGEYI
jgi:hypothetical protein